MPPVSQAQRRWAYWVLNHSKSKRLKKVAKDFVGHGVTGLPERVEDSTPVEKALKLTAHQPMPVQSGGRSQVPPDWHHEGTVENPLNSRQRVVRSGDATGVYRLREDPTRLNHFHVDDVRAVTRGGGRAAMEHLTRMADQKRVSLQLVAEPLNPGGGEGIKMSRRQLRGWYHEFGFRPKQGDVLVRTPARSIEKSLGTAFQACWDRLRKTTPGGSMVLGPNIDTGL